MDLQISPGRHYVLVVDSDCYRARAMLSELRASGCYAATAVTGADALRYVIENEPDAVVADWDLSDMTGPEFARRVKSARFATKVYLHKARPDVSSLRQTLGCGGEDLLSRPSPIASVLRSLRRGMVQLPATSSEERGSKWLRAVRLLQQPNCTGRQDSGHDQPEPLPQREDPLRLRFNPAASTRGKGESA